MSNRSFFLIVGLLFQAFVSMFGQKDDNIWVLGGGSENIVDDLGYQWGNTVLNFQENSPSIYYDSIITLDMRGADASICDNAGNLLLYTNGMYVHNGHHQSVPGLDTIAYGEYWEHFNLKEFLPNGTDWPIGFPSQQSIIIIPKPNDDNNYFIIYNFRQLLPNDPDGYTNETKILCAEVEIDSQNWKGNLIYKDKTLVEGRFNTSLHTVKHANGRDWWLIVQEEYNASYLVFLINPQSIQLIHKNPNVNPIDTEISLARAVFSPNGEKYAVAETLGDQLQFTRITLYNFDRCTGFLELEESEIFHTELTRGSIAYSNSSKYLYIANGPSLFQADISVPNSLANAKEIATWDGSIFKYNEFDPGRKLFFGYMAMAPDGRIYITPSGGVRSLHTIEYPDEYGEDATVIQNKIQLPTQNFNSIPNLPNFRLGPSDGSSCDTLGINNKPIAKFRLDKDTLDALHIRLTDLSYFEPEDWQWDFGDGTEFVGNHPYEHRYAQGGEYLVCLYVSNPYGEDVSCQLVTVGGTVSTMESSRQDVSIYPNPVADELHIKNGPDGTYEYLILDQVGRIVQEGKTESKIDVSSLANGLYVISLQMKGEEIKHRFVKVGN